jgi:hypothetical protein
MSEEEIFKKPSAKAPKKKKPLSEAQLAALAKGRARMAEKRAKEKEELSKQKKKVAKNDAKVVKETATKQKKARQQKKKFLHNQEKEDAVRRKIQENRNKKIEEFENLKYSFMSRLDDEADIVKFNSYFDDIDESMILQPDRLHKHLLGKLPSNTTNIANEENIEIELNEID